MAWGKALILDVDSGLTPKQRAVVRGLATATPIEDIAESSGLTADQVRRMARSGVVLAAVGAQCLQRVHNTAIPLAIRMLTDLTCGLLMETQLDQFGRKKIRDVPAQIPHAVRLSAAQTLLKLGKFGEDAPGAPSDDDLATATPDRLRAIIGAIEDQLAKTATDVTANTPDSAPDDVEDATILPTIPDGYSVLD